jgi:hypothetical protein
MLHKIFGPYMATFSCFVIVSVLTGPEQAGPPFQQKYTAIWQKLTAKSYFKKFRYFSVISRHFPHINF